MTMPDQDAVNGESVPSVGLALDGEILSGRLLVYADTLTLGLVKMADAFDAIDPLVLLSVGETPGTALRKIAAQLAQAVIDNQIDPTASVS